MSEINSKANQKYDFDLDIIKEEINLEAYLDNMKSEFRDDTLYNTEQKRNLNETNTNISQNFGRNTRKETASINSSAHEIDKIIVETTDSVDEDDQNKNKANTFTCNLCEYKSAYKDKLKRHVNIHAGEKPFPCDLREYRNNTVKKVWTMEETCNLIEGYQNYNFLWNPKHADYKNRLKKKDALEELARMFNVSALEIERKLTNINTQYRRERRNYKKFNKSGAAYNFRPKWFAYNLMSFLHDKNKPRVGKESGLEDSLTQNMSDSSLSEDESQSLGDSETPVHQEQEQDSINDNEEISLPEKPPENCAKSKAKCVKDSNSEANAVLAMMNNMYKERKEARSADEFDVFGDLLARKIRNLRTPYARSTIQHHINNLLYSAELGNYDVPPISTTSAVPSCSNVNDYPATIRHNSMLYSNPPSIGSSNSSVNTDLHCNEQS